MTDKEKRFELFDVVRKYNSLFGDLFRHDFTKALTEYDTWLRGLFFEEIAKKFPTDKPFSKQDVILAEAEYIIRTAGKEKV